MKILCFFMLAWLVQVRGEALAQSQRVTLNLKNCSVEEFLQEVKNQTGIRFMYRSESVREMPRFDLEVRQQRIDEVLQQVFGGQGIRFVFDDEVIMLRKEQTDPEKKMVKITGTVKDDKGGPLPGVTVLIKGTSLGTATDPDGRYALTVPEGGHTLLFTMVGMENREMPFSAVKDMELNIILKSAVSEMDEVVVTGIFKKAKESYTGSVSTISKEDLQIHRGQNLLQTLKNADASLNFAVNNVAGSNPNTLPQINIRGNSSLPMSVQEYNESASNAVNTPLIIMDGFEISLEKLMDYNDDEIENINILKDAAATAIYGSRGSNGVIVIVTKQPEAGKLRVNAEAGIDMQVPDLSSYDLLDAREKLELENSLGLYRGNSDDNDLTWKGIYNERLHRVLSGASTDWIHKPIRTGVGSHYNLRLEGGSDQFRWSTTTNYKITEGAMKNSSRRTFNGSVTLMYTVKNLTFKNYTSYGVMRGRESNYGNFSDYVKQQPYNSPYDENGKILSRMEGFYGPDRGTVGNPLYDASLNTKNKSGYEELTDNFAIEWKITDGLTLRGQLGLSTNNSRSDYFLPGTHSYFTTGDNLAIYNADEGLFRKGKYDYGTGNSVTTSGNLTLSYSKLFKDKHSLYVGLDYSVSGTKSTHYNFTFEGFANDNMNFIGNANGYEKDGIPSGTKAKSRRLGFTGNVNYTYDNRYYVDASARVDGSSTFGSDKKYAPFWSVGLGWNLHSEQFLKGNEILNTLRLKASYGQTGSQQGSGSGASTVYAYESENKYMNWIAATLKEWGNPKLTWQTTDEFNVGTEFSLFRGRVKGEFNFYTKTTNNLLSNMDLPHSMGFPSYLANIGEVKNRGWEASATVYVIRNAEKEFNWLVSGQLMYNKNWISKLSEAVKAQTEAALQTDDPEKIPDVANLFYEGRPQNALYAVRSLGIDPSTGREIFLDRNGKVTNEWLAGNKVYMGSADPLYRGNLNTMVMWKGLTFNVSFGYYWGGKTYNQTLVDRVEVTRETIRNSNVDRRVYTDRWQKPGDVAFYKGVSDDETRATSRFVMKNNVLELQSASLQYRWDSDFVRHQLRLSSVTFGVNMSDLFHWSSTRLERGIEYLFARNIQGSIKILF